MWSIARSDLNHHSGERFSLIEVSHSSSKGHVSFVAIVVAVWSERKPTHSKLFA